MTTHNETHTAGPWEASGQTIRSASGVNIARTAFNYAADTSDDPIWHAGGPREAEATANAALIAAAPLTARKLAESRSRHRAAERDLTAAEDKLAALLAAAEVVYRDCDTCFDDGMDGEIECGTRGHMALRAAIADCKQVAS